VNSQNKLSSVNVPGFSMVKCDDHHRGNQNSTVRTEYVFSVGVPNIYHQQRGQFPLIDHKNDDSKKEEDKIEDINSQNFSKCNELCHITEKNA
jgi:hypothetical protein